MSLAHPALNNTGRSKKKKLTQKQQDALAIRWTERNAERKKAGLPKESFDEFLNFVYGKSVNTNTKVKPLSAKYSLSTQCSRINQSAQIVSEETKIVGPEACTVRSIMDPRVLATERPEVREAILAKSHRLMPLYNKGPYQFVTDGEDVSTLGARSRRG